MARGEEFQLAATELVPDTSSATVEATGSGLSITLSVEDLPPAAPGTFYQAWMKGPDGSIPIGTFHATVTDRSSSGRGRRGSLPDHDRHDPAGKGADRSSGRVVLSGDIPTGS